MASSNAEQDETRGDKHHEDEDDEEEENQSEGEEDGEDSPIKSAPSSPSKVSVHWPWALGMSPFFPYLGPVMPFGGFYPLREVQQPSAVAEGLTLNDGARNGAGNPFPIKLHNMLATCEREGLSDVVGFFVHGRAFAIHKPRRFSSEVMPRFFKQTKLSSFHRQLNLYGFQRITSGPDMGGYWHPSFLKDRPHLCLSMKRTKLKGHQKKGPPSYEPNFYACPPISSSLPAATLGPNAMPCPMFPPTLYQQGGFPPGMMPPYGVPGFATPTHTSYPPPAGPTTRRQIPKPSPVQTTSGSVGKLLQPYSPGSTLFRGLEEHPVQGHGSTAV